MADMKKNFLRFIVFTLLSLAIFSAAFAPFIPVTGTANSQAYTTQPAGNSATTATKVNAAGLFLYTVAQQPASQPGFVSTDADKVTQFSLATKYGSQGFLAHNYLAGASFSNLIVGSIITITYADGHSQSYQVQTIRQFQATSPNSATSSFIDLVTGEKLSAKQLFLQTYGIKDNLVFQTCVAKDTELSWGRLFVIATPVK
jgi:hypothetical protein